VCRGDEGIFGSTGQGDHRQTGEEAGRQELTTLAATARHFFVADCRRGGRGGLRRMSATVPTVRSAAAERITAARHPLQEIPRPDTDEAR
jgi:hypothetical protein